jgi:hypothetical protein
VLHQFVAYSAIILTRSGLGGNSSTLPVPLQVHPRLRLNGKYDPFSNIFEMLAQMLNSLLVHDAEQLLHVVVGAVVGQLFVNLLKSAGEYDAGCRCFKSRCHVRMAWTVMHTAWALHRFIEN